MCVAIEVSVSGAKFLGEFDAGDAETTHIDTKQVNKFRKIKSRNSINLGRYMYIHENFNICEGHILNSMPYISFGIPSICHVYQQKKNNECWDYLILTKI